MGRQYFLFGLIILVAAVFRFFSLGQNPPSLTWDEVSWGYNAYSLGISGADEFGRFLPLVYLESFGDFKPPVYAYLDVLPIKLFGLGEFAVRFPSAFFGMLTVFLTYFLVKRIFWKSKNKNSYALFSALILAISPWHVMLSRAAFEANVATFFIVLGVWAFLKGIQDKKWYLVASVVPFALSLYTFNTARIVVPLLVLFLAVIFRRRLMDLKKETAAAVILGIFLILPTATFLVSPQASLRFKEVNIFSDPGVVITANQQISNDGNALWSKLLHNRRLGYGVSYLKHYFDNLSPGFLFIKGDGNPKFSTQTVGQLYLWELPFFIAGAFLLFRKKEGYWWIVPAWLLIGIIPAATARETPHALRTEAALPMFQIMTAYGVSWFVHRISNIKYQILNIHIKYLIYLGTFLLLFLNVLYFAHGYLAHYSREFSGEWQHGYKESLKFAKDVEGNYKEIEFTSDLGRPYIYYLFYNKVAPNEFKNSAIVKRDVFGFVEVESIGKYKFSKDLPTQGGGDILYINVPQKVPGNAKILKKFSLLNGQESLVAYTL